MADINRGEVTQELVKASGLQSIAGVPKQLANQITPTLELNSSSVGKINVVQFGQGAATLLTIPSTMRFFLLSATMTWMKTAADTGTALRITVEDVNGKSQNIMRKDHITATASDGQMAVSIPMPGLELKNVISLSLSGSYTCSTATIIGRLEDD